MPFLIPALAALPSDAAILYLGLGHPDGKPADPSAAQDDGDPRSGDPFGHHWVYRVYYLVCLSSIRLFLVVVPLLFHSYTGTALRFPLLYHLLYWGTLAVVLSHMLALTLINPESLEAIIPLDAASSTSANANNAAAIHELRRIWYVLLLSLASDACHLVMLWHVRSTGPYQHPLRLRKGGAGAAASAAGAANRHPSLYYTLRSREHASSFLNGRTANGGGDGDDPHQPYRSGPHQHHPHPAEAALMSAMTEFVDEMQARLQRTKADWSARLEDFTARLANSSGHHHPSHHQHLGAGDPHHRPATAAVRSLQNHLVPLTPFRVLLQLFADEDQIVAASENGGSGGGTSVGSGSAKLDAVFDMDDGSSMTFYVPQLLSFLLHGAVYKSQSLEDWILGKCAKNVHFAHRCYWFLRSWCLEAPAEAVLSRRGSEPHLSDSHRGLAPFLDEPASPQDSIPCRPRASARRRSTRGGGAGHNYGRTDEKLLPEERAMIERLMLRVKEYGEASATELSYGASDADAGSSADPLAESRTVQFDTTYRPMNSPSDLMSAVESGYVPVDPSTGYPSVKHLDSISAKQRYGFLPLEDEALQRARKERSTPSKLPSKRSPDQDERVESTVATPEFDKTLEFLDSLIHLADSLFRVPAKDRKAELRKQLRSLECELLPSNAVYVPIGNMHHRVWRIVADESVCIGTKERVPCIICLEVVDYAFKKRRPRAWSFLDRLPRRVPASGSRDGTEEATASPNRRVSMEGIEMPDIRSESETIHEWRYARRDPLRRSSIFDLVSSTVRVSMKGPLDKVKSQMRSSYLDRPTEEELRSLTTAEALVREDESAQDDALLGRSAASDHENDVETETVLNDEGPLPVAVAKDAKESSSLSRVNSAASLVSMGQWTSPTPPDRTVVQIRNSHDMDDSARVSLPYGSDQEEEYSRRQSSVKRSNGKAINSKSSSGRPPVVFRESWQSKQDRLRAKSAFGQHPGWKLLPVLIKANDDLRQEQLASQLIYRMAAILAREKVPVWLCPYEIIALTDSGGIIEAIPDTISLDSLKRNDLNYHGLKYFFLTHFGEGTEQFADAQANFVESLAAYSIVCFLLQVKDRHNGKNAGFESAPFKLTRDFVELLGGPKGRLFRTFRELCVKTFLSLRKNSLEIILLVEMLQNGNEELNCFRGRPDEAIRQLRERFRLDLNDRACREYVNCLVDDSIENWRTDWYDRYQRYFVGVL